MSQPDANKNNATSSVCLACGGKFADSGRSAVCSVCLAMYEVCRRAALAAGASVHEAIAVAGGYPDTGLSTALPAALSRRPASPSRRPASPSRRPAAAVRYGLALCPICDEQFVPARSVGAGRDIVCDACLADDAEANEADAGDAAAAAELPALPALPAELPALPAVLPAQPAAACAALGPAPPRTGALVAQALAHDAAHRHAGVADGLFGIEDLATFSRLGHGLPVVRAGDNAPAFDRAESIDVFRERFRAEAPFLADFDLRRHGMVLAGGLVSALLMASPGHIGGAYGDADLFLVGHSDDTAKAAIRALADSLAARAGAGSMAVYRTQGAITFSWREAELRPRVVQVVLRHYAHAAEVIFGFDLGACAMLWDGARVGLTAAGRFAAEHGANVLTLAMRRSSYERRLGRYHQRGFDLVLPDLDACALRAMALGEFAELPYVALSGVRFGDCPCLITAGRLRSRQPGQAPYVPRPRVPGEDEFGSDKVPYGGTHAIRAHNARLLAAPVLQTAGLCAEALYGPDVDIFAIQPAVSDELEREVNRALGRFIDGRKLVKYLGADGAAEVLLAWAAHSGEGQEFGDLVRAVCASARAANPAHAEMAARQRIPFAFRALDDGTSFPAGPAMTAAAWYGGALRERV